MNALPFSVTSVGLRVTLGRLPPANSFAWPGTSRKLWARCVSGMPVSPAITDGIQAPEGVAEKTTPSLSIASTQVVSRAISASSIFTRRISDCEGCSGGGLPILPGRNSNDAICPISLRRSAAYSLDSSRAMGI